MRLEAAGNACLVLAAAAVLSTFAPTAQAQVSIHPRSTTPASWERFAIRVVNGTDTATTGVRVDVPDAVTVLGVEPTAGWTTRRDAGSDSSPQFVEWSGGKLLRGEFLEFAFLGRVIGDARRTDLVFPVTLTQLSVRGVTAIAGTALGVALIALILAIARGRRSG
jgi:uncharacterized protein YcnI